MKPLLPAFAALIMLFAFSCNQHAEDPANSATAVTESLELMQIPKQEDEKASNKKQQDQLPVKNISADWDKKIIRKAVISVEAENFKSYNAQIHGLVTKWEGYIAKEEESGSDNRINNLLTIKVPTDRFDEAISSVSILKGKMLVKQISSEDVSAEVMDIRTRAEAKKRIRLRYLDMLQKAKNIEEIIQVEHEIYNIQEQIEAAEGRLNYLTHATSYSTIELSFFQILDPKAIDEQNPGYATRFLLALNEGLKWVGNLAIFLATLWPVWLFTIIVILAIRRVRIVSAKVNKTTV
jgi:hypothetical protein